ncbi:MAG: TIGR00270 family protein [Candidatus Aenigmarchaeota archaeon]|nr:TIGR00270 family protein [Candidatus Aenigmarchaeota archaeon]
MECELCGRRAEGKARIEGTVVSVCRECSKFGEAVSEAKPVKLPDKPRHRQPEEVYFVDNFSAVIREKREFLSLTREQLAEKIREKASVIERLEKGARPEKHVAEKLERVLGVRLISSAAAEKTIIEKKSSEPLTLGDIVTIKKKKK